MGEADRRTQFVSRSLGDGKPLERARYLAAFGRPLEADFGPVLERLAAAGLLVDTGEALGLSDTGGLLYDLVALAFYPDHARLWLAEREDRAAPATVPGG
jgi:hypothetical protein